MNFAIVGFGRISKRHVEAIDATDRAELVAVCDHQESKMSQLLDERGNLIRVTNYVDLSGHGIHAVAVCTPSGHHPIHAAEIAEQTDIPVVMVEKPISLTVREACELFKRVDRAGKRLVPVYQNRYNPLIQFARKLISDGLLGTIYQFNVNIFWNRNDKYFDIDWHGTRDLDGGVLYTQASHYVDMLLYLFGPVKQAKGLGGRLRHLEVQDSVSAVLEHENGAIGSLNCTVSTYRRNYQTEFTVIGSKGTVRLQGTNLNTIDFWDVEGMEKPDLDFTLEHIYGKGHDLLYQYMLNDDRDMFPSRDEVVAGIELMERLSF